jgi:Zn-dependent protease
MFSVTMYVSIILAFFNMLPIPPLDGSKVLRWNKIVYVAVMAVVFALLLFIIPLPSLLFGLVFMLIIALVVSFFYRGALF